MSSQYLVQSNRDGKAEIPIELIIYRVVMGVPPQMDFVESSVGTINRGSLYMAHQPQKLTDQFSFLDILAQVQQPVSGALTRLDDRVAMTFFRHGQSETAELEDNMVLLISTDPEQPIVTVKGVENEAV